MRNTLSLDERIDEFIRKKFSLCKCDPCTCSDSTKNQYFLELKDVLKRLNLEKLGSYSFKNVMEK